MTERSIELIQFEAKDAGRELAECIREKAQLLMVRADGIERTSATIINPFTENESKEESEAAGDLQQDMTLLDMKENELWLKYKRLLAEYEIRSEREKRKKP